MIMKLGALFSVNLSGLIIAAALQSASAATPEEAAYNATCLSCHSSVSRVVKKVQGGDEVAKRAYLDTFLASHHAEDKALRDQIIQYLVTR